MATNILGEPPSPSSEQVSEKIKAAGSSNIATIHRPKDLLAVISHLIKKIVQ
jgi:hypothetical protein